jgi:hypothetical protein
LWVEKEEKWGGNTNVGGKTEKALTGAEGRVWWSGEDENPEVRGSSRQGTEGDEGRNRKMHEAVASSLPNVGKSISDYTTSHLRRQ